MTGPGIGPPPRAGGPRSRLRATVAAGMIAATVSLAGCGTNPYAAACTLRVNTESLMHGVTRAQAIADCERMMARQSGSG